MHSWWRAFVERFLPWYQPVIQRQRDKRSAEVARRSETARNRAAPIIAAYRRAESVAAQQGKSTAKAVTDLRDAQEDAREAGERLIDEVEGQ